LISDEHSDKLVWDHEQKPVGDREPEVADKDLYDRVYSFEVTQTDEEEETATATDGFMVCIYHFMVPDSGSNSPLDPAYLHYGP